MISYEARNLTRLLWIEILEYDLQAWMIAEKFRNDHRPIDHRRRRHQFLFTIRFTEKDCQSAIPQVVFPQRVCAPAQKPPGLFRSVIIGTKLFLLAGKQLYFLV